MRILPLFLLVLVHTGWAQYRLDTSISLVNRDGSSLRMAWAGGLNSGQYSTMDLNVDGVDDLVVFDRTSNRVNTFLYIDGEYQYAPEFGAQFPQDLTNWMLLRDFNCDGKKDIFTADPLGIRVFVNVSGADSLRWRLFHSRSPLPSPLLTRGFSSNINLQVSSSDIPAIDDIDGDGDLDILVFRFSTTSTVEFHQNMSIERTGSCDSLQLERQTQKWGDFTECGCGDFAFNDDDCSPSGGRLEHLGGKSLLTIDMDGDDDKEVVISEETCTSLFLLENIGSPELADMEGSSAAFPNAINPAQLYIFPAAYHEDIDHDGLSDIIVAPNVASNVNGAVNFSASGWYYKNIGSDATPAFTLVQQNLLQEHMLDVGENACPAFVDVDNDGDEDMLLGSFANPAIQLYHNTGDHNNPILEFANPDFGGLSVFGLYNIKPSLVDINTDGRPDLVLSASSTISFTTSIYYMLNKGAGLQLDGQLQTLFSNLSSNDNYKLYDVNTDGLPDLLIGRSTGQLEYHKNVGSPELPAFQLENDAFYGLGPSIFRLNPAVEVADLDKNGMDDMLVGDWRGNVFLYPDFVQNLEAPQESVSLQMVTDEGKSTDYHLGSKLIPRVANVFEEDRPAIFFGTGQGGVVVLRDSGASAAPVRDLLAVYPNPVRKGEILTIGSKVNMPVTIVSLLGQAVTDRFILPAGEPIELDTTPLTPGVYLILGRTEGGYSTRKFIVTR